MLKVETTVQIGNDRAQGMSPENVVEYFARVKLLLEELEIREPSHVFNLDECGFSVKGMTRGRRVKRVVQAETTVHQRTISWAGSVDHVTCMTVVSASGIL